MLKPAEVPAPSHQGQIRKYQRLTHWHPREKGNPADVQYSTDSTESYVSVTLGTDPTEILLILASHSLTVLYST